jgi:hypothetical protein
LRHEFRANSLSRLGLRPAEFHLLVRLRELPRRREALHRPICHSERTEEPGIPHSADSVQNDNPIYAGLARGPLLAEVGDDLGGEAFHRASQVALRKATEIHVDPEVGNAKLLLKQADPFDALRRVSA